MRMLPRYERLSGCTRGGEGGPPCSRAAPLHLGVQRVEWRALNGRVSCYLARSARSRKLSRGLFARTKPTKLALLQKTPTHAGNYRAVFWPGPNPPNWLYCRKRRRMQEIISRSFGPDQTHQTGFIAENAERMHDHDTRYSTTSRGISPTRMGNPSHYT